MFNYNHVPEEQVDLKEVVINPRLFGFRRERDVGQFIKNFSHSIHAMTVLCFIGCLCSIHQMAVSYTSLVMRFTHDVKRQEVCESIGARPFCFRLSDVIDDLVTEPIAFTDESPDVVFRKVESGVAQDVVYHPLGVVVVVIEHRANRKFFVFLLPDVVHSFT